MRYTCTRARLKLSKNQSEELRECARPPDILAETFIPSMSDGVSRATQQSSLKKRMNDWGGWPKYVQPQIIVSEA